MGVHVILSVYLTDKFCPCHLNSQMTPLTVITLHVRNGREHRSVTSGQSFPHCRHWKIALWFMSVVFACRTGSCLQLYLVDLTLAWSSIHSHSSLHLTHQAGASGTVTSQQTAAQAHAWYFTSEKPGSTSVPPAWSCPLQSTPRVSTVRHSHVCSVQCWYDWPWYKKKLSAFQNFIVDDFILTFYSPRGGVFITQWHRSRCTRGSPGLCLLSCVIINSAPFYS